MKFLQLDSRFGFRVDSSCFTLIELEEDVITGVLSEKKSVGYYSTFSGLLDGLLDRNIATSKSVEDIQRSIKDLYRVIDEQFPDGVASVHRIVAGILKSEPQQLDTPLIGEDGDDLI